MEYVLTLRLESQPEGGFTITCKEIPELITECDTLDEMEANVIDAFAAVVELYEHNNRPLPNAIKYSGDEFTEDSMPSFETVVALNEVSKHNQKIKAAWL